MPRCEDFPCCGHEAGDCPTFPSSRTLLPYPCLGCGKPIRKARAWQGHESYHGPRCAERHHARREGGE